MVPGMASLSYEDRLKHLNLYTLQYRRDRGALITMYKIYHELIDINMEALFTKSSTNNMDTRSHSHKLEFKKCIGDIRRNTFSQRVIVPWNTLPRYVIESPTVDSFKRNLDKHE